ncbi:MAG: YfiR family protein [Verrucomicrobia bacterium]|nr:YfiR family protein [Verrucomicrobiota bacterium]
MQRLRSTFLRSALQTCLALGLAVVTQIEAAAQRAPAPATLDAPSVTAAYILNFIRFTEWPAATGDKPSLTVPATPDAPYLIGVAGHRELLDALIQITEGQRVRGHPLHVINVKSTDELPACHVAYLAPPGGPYNDATLRIPAALQALQGLPVLTFSTAPGFTRSGGVVQLFQDGQHLRFDIAADAARSLGLTIHSRLLALARPAPAP